MKDTISKVQQPLDSDSNAIVWSTYLRLLNNLANLLAPTDFGAVYGVPRGGLFIATFLSYRFNKPLLLNEADIKWDTLVVDDISDSGKTLEYLRKRIGFDFLTASIYTRYKSTYKTNYTVKELQNDDWIIFPYE